MKNGIVRIAIYLGVAIPNDSKREARQDMKCESLFPRNFLIKSLFLLGAGVFSCFSTSASAHFTPNPLVSGLVQWHYDDCQAQVDLRDDKAKDWEFSYDPQDIYDIDLGDGVIGTVIYRSFYCEGEGHSWCGSGGCGYFIVVGDKIFGRSGGYPPEMITPKELDEPILLMPIHGSACEGVQEEDISGVFTCYLVATWHSYLETFQSYEGTYPLDVYSLVDGVLLNKSQ